MIDQVYNNGDITASGNNIGGIAGYLYHGNITNAYNRAEIIGNDTVGGILGFAYRYVRIGSSTYVYNHIDSAYNSGLVSGVSNVNGVIGNDSAQNYSGGKP